MTENELATMVIQSAINIHKRLGPGLLESVYGKILSYELAKQGLSIETEKPISLLYDELIIEDAFRADIIVNESLIIEVKSVKELEAVHQKQLLTYLKLTNLKLGILINFNTELLKQGICRVINGKLV